MNPSATHPWTRGDLWLGGCTASGKSEVALILAEHLGAEILCVDSMQVYRGLDIGTAKPGLEERRRVAHHLLDVVDLSVDFTVADFAERAMTVVADIHRRGGNVLLCGGTGLYFKALFEGLGSAPASDPVLRRQLEETPVTRLLQELEEHDSETFETIDRSNPRRVIRAVEILRMSGRSAVQQRAPWSVAGQGRAPAGFVLERDPVDLRTRIDRRVKRMLEAGLVEETQSLRSKGLEQNRTAMQAIGYHQVVEFLRGECTREAMEEEICRRTRQLARRQRNWFRGRLEATLLPVDAKESAANTAERILALARQTTTTRDRQPGSTAGAVAGSGDLA